MCSQTPTGPKTDRGGWRLRLLNVFQLLGIVRNWRASECERLTQTSSLARLHELERVPELSPRLGCPPTAAPQTPPRHSHKQNGDPRSDPQAAVLVCWTG